jgi:hypothetical protein
MNEANETKKSKNITFRLSSEQYDQVERAALAAGEEPNSWCRRIVLTQLTDGFGLTKNERLMYEEIARTRYLVGHGFRILFSSKDVTADTWKTITTHVDRIPEKIADSLLLRRKP